MGSIFDTKTSRSIRCQRSSLSYLFSNPIEGLEEPSQSSLDPRADRGMVGRRLMACFGNATPGPPYRGLVPTPPGCLYPLQKSIVHRGLSPLAFPLSACPSKRLPAAGGVTYPTLPRCGTTPMRLFGLSIRNREDDRRGSNPRPSEPQILSAAPFASYHVPYCSLDKPKIRHSRGRVSLCVRVRPSFYCCRIAAI